MGEDRPGHVSRPSMDINETLDLDETLKMPAVAVAEFVDVEEGDNDGT